MDNTFVKALRMTACGETSLGRLDLLAKMAAWPNQTAQEKEYLDNLKKGEAAKRVFLCCFVRAGRPLQANGQPADFEITPQALRDAVERGLFENRSVFVDHSPAGENPSLRDLVGVTQSSAWYAERQAVTGLILFIDSPLSDCMTNLLDQMLAEETQLPDVGLSIVFYPRKVTRHADGRLKTIESIEHVQSVDLVFQPAAGGRVLQALSAQRCAGDDPTHPSHLTQKGEISMNETTPTQDVTLAGWQEAATQAAAQMVLDASGLPEPARRRLAGQRYTAPEELEIAIENERQYLAALQENQVVQLSGPAPRDAGRSVHLSGMLTSLERLSLAVDGLIGGRAPLQGAAPLSGIRELYHLLSGDYEMTGLFQPERVELANVDSSTMAGLVANALNKALVNEFQEYPRWWEPIVLQQDFASLQTVKWITLGGIGELPTVAEGAAYSELTWDDASESAAFVKKGGYLGLTIEAIDKDDTGRLRAAPRALAQAAWLTLSKAVAGIFTANSGAGPTLSDSTALFHASHNNLGSAALSWTSYVAARTAMRKQTELNSGERLGALTAPRYLLVPPDLEITALQTLASDRQPAQANADANPLAEGDTFQARMAAARGRVIVVDLWSDVNNWAAVADPRLYPTLGLAFRYGRTPEVFSVAAPNAGLMFSNDTMPVKARFFFAVGPIDYRGLYKANVA